MRKKGVLIVLIMLLMICGCGKSEREIRATWISYIDYTEILWGKTEEEYRDQVEIMLENLKELKVNAVYVHASAFTDAYYPSQIYPASQYITGSIGDRLSFDPFGILVERAKEKGFSVEAWINPLRSFTKDQMLSVPESFIHRKWIREKNSSIVFFKDRWYLNPASKEAQNTIVSVVEELLENYSLDGIHFDDYFYPEGIDETFDQKEYAEDGNGRTRAEFRKESVNQLVQKISQAIKRKDPDCRFTISPAGNIQYSTESIYGDVKTWIKEEWIDQVIPQIYFGYEHEVLPYDECLDQWEALVKGTSVGLVPGLAAYKINTVDQYAKSGSREWIESESILSRQIKEARESENYEGFSLYSYHSIFYPEQESEEKVWNEITEVVELLTE